jgi:cation transport ATPase
MERFNALGRGAQLMLIAGVLLFIDLFLPWQDFDVGGIADELGVDATFSGWRGFAGVVLGLLTIVLLAWLAVRLASVNIPLPVSTAMTGALIGALIAVFGIIKLLTILGDEPTIWAWIGTILAILVAVGAFMAVQEAGGVETLRSEIPSSRPTGATMTSPPPPQTTTPPPPAAPEAAPPAAESPPTTRPGASSGPESPSDVPGDDRQA